MKPDKIIKTELKAYSGFRLHASIYALVIGALWLVWILSGSGILYTWLLVPTLVWGAALAVHYIFAYNTFRKNKISS